MLRLFKYLFLIFIYSVNCSSDVAQSMDDVALEPTIPSFNIPPADYILKADYSYIDTNKLVSSKRLITALKFYEFNLNQISNQRYITTVDFSKHSNERRLFLIDMITGEVLPLLTTLGRFSDLDNDGYAESFSNEIGSNMSSLGFYLTGQEYLGVNGRSMRLHGLSTTNSNAFARSIVVHGADYVSELLNYAGRSLGCPALDRKYLDYFINKTVSGSIIYISN